MPPFFFLIFVENLHFHHKLDFFICFSSRESPTQNVNTYRETKLTHILCSPYMKPTNKDTHNIYMHSLTPYNLTYTYSEYSGRFNTSRWFWIISVRHEFKLVEEIKFFFVLLYFSFNAKRALWFSSYKKVYLFFLRGKARVTGFWLP